MFLYCDAFQVVTASAQRTWKYFGKNVLIHMKKDFLTLTISKIHGAILLLSTNLSKKKKILGSNPLKEINKLRKQLFVIKSITYQRSISKYNLLIGNESIKYVKNKFN